MVPGKKYGPEDYLRIVWRRKWLVVAPLVVGAAGAFLYGRTLPNVYRSEALVLIIPQQIPEKYMRSAVDESITTRLNLMRQQILSRARLEALIEEFDLYREERKVLLMDQVVERMKDDVGVNVPGAARRQSPNHFVVSYESGNPHKAVQVTERLSNLFVQEHTEGRNNESDATTQFLQRLADESLRQLQEHERRLADFKRANVGRLPDDVGTGLQLISNARQQVQTLTEGLSRDRERHMMLERQLAEETAGVAVTAPGLVGSDSAPLPPAAQQLAVARTALDGLLLRLKEDHPDVRIARNRLKDLERRAEAEALQQPLNSATTGVVLSPADADRQKRMARLRTEIEKVEREIQAKQTAIQHTEAAAAAHERRVQAAPGLQTEMAELMRGYETVRGTYANLLAKLQDAKLASNLEQQQVSQRLRIVDPPRRPDRPLRPDRRKMNMMGALAGLTLGLLLAAMLEYRDTSLRTDDDVLVALSLPVLALVPTMRGAQPRRWRRLLGSSAGMAAVCLLSVAWKLGFLAEWGR